MRIAWLKSGDPPSWFPPLSQALREPNGLLAAGGDLSPERLRAAYARGIFPWYSQDEPVLWWSPDPREVLFPAEFHRSRSLQRTLRRGTFQITFDANFPAVIDGCAVRGAEDGKGTWITPQMRAAYCELHRMGQAHSVEVWAAEELAGGLYGVRCGAVFSGESMFSLRADASKAALSWLVDRCHAMGIALIDCQMPSAHLRRLGSRAIARAQFVEFLAGPAPA